MINFVLQYGQIMLSLPRITMRLMAVIRCLYSLKYVALLKFNKHES